MFIVSKLFVLKNETTCCGNQRRASTHGRFPHLLCTSSSFLIVFLFFLLKMLITEPWKKFLTDLVRLSPLFPLHCCKCPHFHQPMLNSLDPFPFTFFSLTFPELKQDNNNNKTQPFCCCFKYKLFKTLLVWFRQLHQACLMLWCILP